MTGETRARCGTAFYFAYFFVFFMGMNIATAFLPLYYSSVGCTSGQIGTIIAAGPIATIAGQYIFGRLTDRVPVRYKTLVLGGLYVASCAVLAAYRLGSAFTFLISISFLFTFFNGSVLQLSDSAALDYSVSVGSTYNRIRLGGTIGYAVMAILVGRMIASFGEPVIFAAAIISFALSALMAAALPRPKRTPDSELLATANKRERVRYAQLFTDPKLVAILLYSFFLYIPISFYNSFNTLYLNEATNGDAALVGIIILFSTLSEVPFLLLADKIERRTGCELLLCVSGFAMSLRWLLYSLTMYVPFVVAINLLHGLSHIVSLYCTVNYIRRSVLPGLRASGQTLLGIITYGVSRILGNLLGGIVSDAFTISGAYRIAAFVSLFASVGFTIFIIYDRSKERSKVTE